MPIFTIDCFDRPKSDLPYFIIKRIEDRPKSIQLCATAHRHNCYIIMFITQGSGQHIIDGTVYDICPHSVFFIMPGQIHYYIIGFPKMLKGSLFITHWISLCIIFGSAPYHKPLTFRNYTIRIGCSLTRIKASGL